MSASQDFPTGGRGWEAPEFAAGTPSAGELSPERGHDPDDELDAEARSDVALAAGEPSSEAVTHHLPSANASPSLAGSDADAALRLANEVRPLLGRQGFGDQRIDELAQSYIGQNIGETAEQFLLWAQAEGPLRQPWEPLI